MQDEATCRIAPENDLVAIGQFAGADRDTLLDMAATLTIWLATSMISCRDIDAEMALEERGLTQPALWRWIRSQKLSTSS
jgi:hypothetical protein